MEGFVLHYCDVDWGSRACLIDFLVCHCDEFSLQFLEYKFERN